MTKFLPVARAGVLKLATKPDKLAKQCSSLTRYSRPGATFGAKLNGFLCFWKFLTVFYAEAAQKLDDLLTSPSKLIENKKIFLWGAAVRLSAAPLPPEAAPGSAIWLEERREFGMMTMSRRRKAHHHGKGQNLLLILASASPARQAMLRNAGLKCFVIPADLDEPALKSGFAGLPEALAMALARAKAGNVALHYRDALVIGADQLLVCAGETFDKPRDLAAAAAQLRKLSGRTHRLITAVCVQQGADHTWEHVAQAELTMRVLSETFIADYLAAEGAAVLGSVGAYRLEGLGSQLFSHVEGDYFTILGLNLLPLLGHLRAAGVLAV